MKLPGNNEIEATAVKKIDPTDTVNFEQMQKKVFIQGANWMKGEVIAIIKQQKEEIVELQNTIYRLESEANANRKY